MHTWLVVIDQKKKGLLVVIFGSDIMCVYLPVVARMKPSESDTLKSSKKKNPRDVAQMVKEFG